MENDGNKCNEEDSCGYNVEYYRLIHPEYYFVGSKVGGISMEGDEHIIRKLLLSSLNFVVYNRVSISDKRFTLLDIIALGGSPAMCTLIIQGNRSYS